MWFQGPPGPPGTGLGSPDVSTCACTKGDKGDRGKDVNMIQCPYRYSVYIMSCKTMLIGNHLERDPYWIWKAYTFRWGEYCTQDDVRFVM